MEDCTQVKALPDGRAVSMTAFEAVSFPEFSGELAERRNGFLQTVKEFYKLCAGGDTMLEFLWLSDEAKNQTYVCNVRIFCILG